MFRGAWFKERFLLFFVIMGYVITNWYWSLLISSLFCVWSKDTKWRHPLILLILKNCGGTERRGRNNLGRRWAGSRAYSSVCQCWGACRSRAAHTPLQCLPGASSSTGHSHPLITEVKTPRVSLNHRPKVPQDGGLRFLPCQKAVLTSSEGLVSKWGFEVWYFRTK